MPSPLPETRASLILRLRDASDLQAWDEFVAVYAPVIYRVARCRGLQPADADDLVQEVLAAVARHVDQWLERADRGRFQVWLLAIARNQAVNFLTRGKYRALATGRDSQAWLAQLPESTDDPLGALLDLEFRRQIFRQACDRIRPTVAEHTWDAFWLTSVDQLPAAEVAARLSISVGSVYIARSRIMAKLRETTQLLQQQSDRQRPMAAHSSAAGLASDEAMN